MKTKTFRPRSLALWTGGLLSLVLAPPAALLGQAFGIGVSSVRSQAFANEAALFFPPQQGDLFAFSLAAGDWNGDGADDIASGLPLDDGVLGVEVLDAGAVQVRYAIPGIGMSAASTVQMISQFDAGSPDPDEVDDRFGYAVAAGDFDGDGKDDLAVGIPGNGSYSFDYSAGAVAVHFGQQAGLPGVPAEFLVRGQDGLPANDINHYSIQFGWALAVGDFNGDGRDDLAAGSPGDDLIGPPQSIAAGSVTELLGSAAGLLPFAGQLLSQDEAGMIGAAESNDLFGKALASGDFNGDGRDDLAIGVPGENDTGAVQIVFGGPGGLDASQNVIYFESDLGGTSESGDTFGAAVAAGDFDGDGFADLAVGVPLEDIGSGADERLDTGAVYVLYGAAAGFDLPRTDHFLQSDIYGFALFNHAGDDFSEALAAGDFDRDGFDDLAIGQPGDDGGGGNSGAVTVLMGKSGGFLQAYGDIVAGAAGIAGTLQANQDFGSALAVGDFDGDGVTDLVVGAPYFDAPGLGDAGAQIVLYGSCFSSGFDSGAIEAWSASVP